MSEANALGTAPRTLSSSPSTSLPGLQRWPGRPRPKPRVNLTRFHGVFVRGGHPPNSKYRARVTPARRGKGVQRAATDDVDEPTLAEHRAARACPALSGMTWAQRLKRVFGIDIST